MPIIFKKQFFLIFLLFLVLTPFSAKADTVGQRQTFNVEASYGADTQKKQVSASLIRASDNLYFYVEDSFWDKKNDKERADFNTLLSSLGKEFDTNAYPKLTATFGSEAIPGVDKDKKITVLFYSMKPTARGYVRNIDGYEKTVNPFSNQREMMYLNADNLSNPLMKAFLAHEFMHLITFNQKELKYNVTEDVWLNEARAEYAPTLLGYNDDATTDNYLSNRARAFVNASSDSLVEWKGSTDDYGVVSMFVHYLVDHYGVVILVDSLKSKEVGIDSLNEALLKNNAKEDFNDVYTNFTIAAYLNDCTVSDKYCFKNPNLVDLHVLPFSNYLPFSGDSNLFLGQFLKDYAAHWQKFSGGVGTLKLTFKNPSNADFVIPYVIKNTSGGATVNFLKLNKSQSSDLSVPNIGKDITSVIVIPSVQFQNSNDTSLSYYYSLTAASFSDTTVPNTGTDTGNSGTDTPGSTGTDTIKLPFQTDKPLGQMNREELLTVLLRLIITLLSQGKTLPI
jgi:hypothetical protein